MTEVVTRAEMKMFIRVDGDDEDAIIDLLIANAVEAVENAINGPITEPVSPRVKVAVMTHVARIWIEREDGADLPASAARLLFPLRTLDI